MIRRNLFYVIIMHEVYQCSMCKVMLQYVSLRKERTNLCNELYHRASWFALHLTYTRVGILRQGQLGFMWQWGHRQPQQKQPQAYCWGCLRRVKAGTAGRFFVKVSRRSGCWLFMESWRSMFVVCCCWLLQRFRVPKVT